MCSLVYKNQNRFYFENLKFQIFAFLILLSVFELVCLLKFQRQKPGLAKHARYTAKFSIGQGHKMQLQCLHTAYQAEYSKNDDPHPEDTHGGPR